MRQARLRIRGDEVKGRISPFFHGQVIEHFERPDRLRILDLDAPSPSKLELPPHSISVLLLG